jgi:16S rRNA (uracil1498-N3)-methyltransferase
VAQVFVDDPTSPELSEQDRHHLLRVLRLRPGEVVVACDGRGRSVHCRFTGTGALLEPVGPPVLAHRPVPAITVAFAPGKGDRPEWVVQKLTELGVDRIVPITTERSVVRWRGERAQAATDRLRRIAREAAAQSRRAWLPEVATPTTLTDLVSTSSSVALADPGGDRPSLLRPTVVVGPEGGWSGSERALGLPRVALADTILRSETAAVAVAAILGALRAGLVTASADQ